MTVLPIGSRPAPARMTRRRLMQIGAALAAGSVAACAPQTSEEARRALSVGVAPWPEVDVPVVIHPGYGTYPDYDAIGATGPWPQILSARHQRQLEKFSDLILPATDNAPAPSAVGIADFFNDWTSAPYPYMSDTRRIVHEGFAWLDAQMALDHRTDWLGASEAQAVALLQRMRDRAATDDAEPSDPTVQAEREALKNPGEMYTHLRKLVIGAYYTTPEGEADLGHIHAQPLAGDYPGPTGEALDHIKGVMAELDLGWGDLPIGPPPYPDKVPYAFTGDEPS